MSLEDNSIVVDIDETLDIPKIETTPVVIPKPPVIIERVIKPRHKIQDRNKWDLITEDKIKAVCDRILKEYPDENKDWIVRRDCCIFALMGEHGKRISEVLALKKEDIRRDESVEIKDGKRIPKDNDRIWVRYKVLKRDSGLRKICPTCKARKSFKSIVCDRDKTDLSNATIIKANKIPPKIAEKSVLYNNILFPYIYNWFYQSIKLDGGNKTGWLFPKSNHAFEPVFDEGQLNRRATCTMFKKYGLDNWFAHLFRSSAATIYANWLKENKEDVYWNLQEKFDWEKADTAKIYIQMGQQQRVADMDLKFSKRER